MLPTIEAVTVAQSWNPLVTGVAPWIARIDEIRAQMAVNVEADHKVAQLSSEIQNLARGIKTRVSEAKATQVHLN